MRQQLSIVCRVAEGFAVRLRDMFATVSATGNHSRATVADVVATYAARIQAATQTTMQLLGGVPTPVLASSGAAHGGGANATRQPGHFMRRRFMLECIAGVTLTTAPQLCVPDTDRAIASSFYFAAGCFSQLQSEWGPTAAAESRIEGSAMAWGSEFVHKDQLRMYTTRNQHGNGFEHVLVLNRQSTAGKGTDTLSVDVDRRPGTICVDVIAW